MQTLFKRKIITNSNIDELDYLIHKIDKLTNNEEQLINAIVILGCNLDCSYCFEKWFGEYELQKNLLITETFIESYLKYLKNEFKFDKIKKFKLAWFGGEPMLAWDQIKNLIKKIKDITIKYNIKFDNYLVTNGTLLNKIKYEEYKLLDFIQITIDGSEKTHNKYRKYKSGKGTYDQIYKSIMNIPLEFPLVIRINITENNLDTYYEVLNAFKFRSKNTTIDISPIFQNLSLCSNNNFNSKRVYGITLEEYSKIESYLIKYAINNSYKISTTLFPSCVNSSCWRINKNSFHITTELKLYSCVTELGNVNDYYGYIDNNGDIIITDNKKYIDNKIKKIIIPILCKNCCYAPICALSCKHKDHCTTFKNNLPERIFTYMKIKKIL